MELLKLSSAAKKLDTSSTHLRNAIIAGRIPGYRVGKKALRVDIAEVLEKTRIRPKVDIKED